MNIYVCICSLIDMICAISTFEFGHFVLDLRLAWLTLSVHGKHLVGNSAGLQIP